MDLGNTIHLSRQLQPPIPVKYKRAGSLDRLPGLLLLYHRSFLCLIIVMFILLYLFDSYSSCLVHFSSCKCMLGGPNASLSVHLLLKGICYTFPGPISLCGGKYNLHVMCTRLKVGSLPMSSYLFSFDVLFPIWVL